MHVRLLTIPFDTALRGWRMGAGPQRLLDAGLVRHLEAQGHRVETTAVEPGDGKPAEIRTAFELMRNVAGCVRRARDDGCFPLVLSGNCSPAAGILSGLTPGRRGVFWFDAHGDINTPDTTTSGFIDGTALAASLGLCWRGMTSTIPGFQPVRADDTVLLGTRDLDQSESDLMSRLSLALVAPSDIEGERLDDEVSRIAAAADVAYVHCDLDVLDPSEGGVNPFQAPNGVRASGVLRALHTIGRALPVAAAAITAYAPEYDAEGRIPTVAFSIVDALLASGDGRFDA